MPSLAGSISSAGIYTSIRGGPTSTPQQIGSTRAAMGAYPDETFPHPARAGPLWMRCVRYMKKCKGVRSTSAIDNPSFVVQRLRSIPSFVAQYITHSSRPSCRRTNLVGCNTMQPCLQSLKLSMALLLAGGMGTINAVASTAQKP